MSDLTRQLQQQVLSARSEGRQLNIVGGGSKAFMGRQSSGDLLDVGQHRGVVSYQPVELVVTARAGTPIGEIEALLEEQGQMLAFEPPRFSDQSTLGGTLACNLSGPGRPWQGSMRDHLLGIRLINGRGEALRFGGQVMKNVAGYDVSRLMAGAMGTLGVITEVSLKVLPRPACQVTLVESMGLDEALRVSNERAATPKPISAVCWWQGKLHTRLAGARSSVESTVQQWGGEPYSEADEFWRQLRDQQLEFFAGDTPLWRFSVSPTAPQPALDGEWLVDWGGAQRWLRAAGDIERYEPVAKEMGGSVTLFKGGDRSGEVFHSQPHALQTLQQRLKRGFDPDSLFNPGRLYSWM
ncbi:glycolate oxidase subunit GlcE [Motiliproteus sp. SC1-56]|uniref:glycolate oxidase subunit GlcE n=1 Tax=Motiliproteus sp. SC1-56 TaxID=2799565 RepID=UPI001A8D0497|nr:glycolate oxidase subunit GlcE [Motiliproteus sp. SC1-56]